jgi:hypothetical protein
MTDLRQAAEMALEALDLSLEDKPYYVKVGLAIVALRQALAERQECETCANKRKRLLEAGFLKLPLRSGVEE